jgi:hypothetical protein
MIDDGALGPVQHSFERQVRLVFNSAAVAARNAAASLQTGSHRREEDTRGQAAIVVRDASERLLTALRAVIPVVELEPGVWMVGDFTQGSENSPLHVKEAAVDAA